MWCLIRCVEHEVISAVRIRLRTPLHFQAESGPRSYRIGGCTKLEEYFPPRPVERPSDPVFVPNF